MVEVKMMLNVKFEILSSSPGVSAKFSDDGRKLLTKGNGNVNH